MLQEHRVEHGEDGLLLGLGQTGEAPELALELAGRPALGELRDAEQHGEEDGELGDERDKELETDFLMGDRLQGDAEVRSNLLLGEARLLAQWGAAAGEVRDELARGRHPEVERSNIGPCQGVGVSSTGPLDDR